MSFLKGSSNTTFRHVGEFMPRPCRPRAGEAPSEEALVPVEGVTIERYAAIVRGIAACNSDASVLPAIANHHGVDTDTWPRVQQGWNARIRSNPAVARAFSDIYHSSDAHSTVP